MGIAADLKVLYHLAIKPVRGATHAERLESFYASQAAHYDNFRERLLKGRDELLSKVAHVGGTWVDMGAGTGRNVARAEALGANFSEIFLVDLSTSLLEVAKAKLTSRPSRKLHFLPIDATQLDLPRESVQLMTFSYSLTMIPNWFVALERAYDLLAPGGTIAVVDFYVSRKHVEGECVRHSWFQRTLAQQWFAIDNVMLSPDHVPWLRAHFEPKDFQECLTPLPYVPFLKFPYYQFIGQKRRSLERRTSEG